MEGQMASDVKAQSNTGKELNPTWPEVGQKRQAAEPYIGCADCDNTIDESVLTPYMDIAQTFTILLAFAVAFM